MHQHPKTIQNVQKKHACQDGMDLDGLFWLKDESSGLSSPESTLWTRRLPVHTDCLALLRFQWLKPSTPTKKAYNHHICILHNIFVWSSTYINIIIKIECMFCFIHSCVYTSHTHNYTYISQKTNPQNSQPSPRTPPKKKTKKNTHLGHASRNGTDARIRHQFYGDFGLWTYLDIYDMDDMDGILKQMVMILLMEEIRLTSWGW